MFHSSTADNSKFHSVSGVAHQGRVQQYNVSALSSPVVTKSEPKVQHICRPESVAAARPSDLHVVPEVDKFKEPA
jgi:hypothetical protein